MVETAFDRWYAGRFAEHREVVEATCGTCRPAFSRLVDVCATSLTNGGKLLFFGNGGSAADAQHLATELTVRYVSDRPAIAAIALTTDSSALTAIGNDFGFSAVFARQIEALGRRGDVAIGISTSGQSENILAGLLRARDLGLIAAGLSGRDGGRMVGLADPLVVVPSSTTARIQEMHILLGQLLCEAIEHRLGYTTAETSAGEKRP